MAPQSGSISFSAGTGDDHKRRETEAPKTWTWTAPSLPDDDECPHGLADRAWCGFCSPAVTPQGARNGRR